MNIDDPKARRRNRFRRRRQHAARKNRTERTLHQREQVLVLKHPECDDRELSFPETMARKARTIGRSLDQGMRHDIETAREVLRLDDEGVAYA